MLCTSNKRNSFSSPRWINKDQYALLISLIAYCVTSSYVSNIVVKPVTRLLYSARQIDCNASTEPLSKKTSVHNSKTGNEVLYNHRINRYYKRINFFFWIFTNWFSKISCRYCIYYMLVLPTILSVWTKSYR